MTRFRFLKLLAFSTLAAAVLSGPCLAATVEPRTIHSSAMNQDLPANVIVPDSYAASKSAYPVVYLLHGFGGSPDSWLKKTSLPKELADQYQMILVCPDGKDSWYWDAPNDPNYRYETHITGEVVDFIDKNYRTLPSREGRALLGISMGGQGAMYLALRHKDLFGAVGSMSGGLDIRPFLKNWNIALRLGSSEEHPEQWEAFTVINQLANLKNGELAIVIDCGTADFFLPVNRNFHDALTRQKIEHDYIEGTGGHNWAYWNHSIRYPFLFLDQFFKKAATPDTPKPKPANPEETPS